MILFTIIHNNQLTCSDQESLSNHWQQRNQESGRSSHEKEKESLNETQSCQESGQQHGGELGNDGEAETQGL